MAIIVLAGVLAYANSFSGPFIFDDEATLVQNTSIRHLRSMAVLLPQREMPTAGRPIVNVSFAINYALGGMSVRGYHVTNLAIHLLCAVVLFALVRRTLELARPRFIIPSAGLSPRRTSGQAGPRSAALKGPPCSGSRFWLQPDAVDIAFAVALIWTLHPLNTEVVDYVTQRTESMMALFYLLTMYASVRAVAVRLKPDTTGTVVPPVRLKPDTTGVEVRLKPDTRLVASGFSRTSWQAAAIVACALGMACKESMVTAPVMVMLYDRAFVFDSIKKALRERWPLYAGLAATWIVLAAVNRSGSRIHSAGFSTGISPWTYLLNQSVMIVRYLRLAIWPRSLVLAYGTPQPVTFGDALPYALVVIALLALTALALWRRPMVGFLGAWIFITLAPTSSIVPIATEVGAERRMYLALAAIVALVVVGVWSSRGVRLQPDHVIDGVRLQPDNGPPKGGRHRWIHAILLAAVCAALATATAIRNREYESSLTLSQTVLQRWPTAYAHAMVGIELAKIGRHDEAMAQLREATSGLPKARYHLGGELFNRGDGDQAIGELQRYVAEEPYALEAVRARLMIGQVLLRQRKYSPAIDQFRLVLSMTPASDDAHILAFGLIADALFGQEQLEEAARYYRAYLSAKPDDVAARGNFAKALFNKGDVDGAAAEARAILRTSDDAAAHDLLGRALGSQGKLEEARIEFERALKIDPNFQQAREDLAVIKKAKG